MAHPPTPVKLRFTPDAGRVNRPSGLWAHWVATARSWIVAWGRIVFLAAVLGVLLLSPSTYRPGARRRMLRQLYVDTAPILLGFTALAALLCLVITRIVVVTALSYGLSRYAQEMVIRVLVLELIPLTATLFVAMRCAIPNGADLADLRAKGHLMRLEVAGYDPVRMEFVPRAVSCFFASILLAALSCVVASVMAYLSVYGFTMAGLPAFTRMFGQVFTPAVTLVFALKTFCSSLVVALIPLASGMYNPRGYRRQSELGGLARMFAVLLVIEIASLVGNYY